MPGEGRQEEMMNGKKGDTEEEEREGREGRKRKDGGMVSQCQVIKFNKNQ